MKRNISALLIGLLMGAGLYISEMVDPKRVFGFLNITGPWDPTLIFVMGGGLFVTLVTFRFITKCSKPQLCEQFDLPTKTQIDKSLIIGAVIFGIGWGLVGVCPGPALAGVAFEIKGFVSFVLSMLTGMIICEYCFKK